MLTTELDVTLSMVWIVVLANFVAVAVAFLFLRPLTKLTFISGSVLVPFLLLLLGIGAYTSSNNFADVLVMLGAAAIGVGCIRWDWPRVPFLLAIVLGGIAERYLFVSYSLFGWSWLSRPGVLVLAATILLVLLQPALRARRARRRGRRQPPVDSEDQRRDVSL